MAGPHTSSAAVAAMEAPCAETETPRDMTLGQEGPAAQECEVAGQVRDLLQHVLELGDDEGVWVCDDDDVRPADLLEGLVLATESVREGLDPSNYPFECTEEMLMDEAESIASHLRLEAAFIISEGRDELSRVARLLAEDLQGGPVIALAIKLIRDTLIRTGRTLNGADGSALPVETERKCVQLLADGIEQVLRSVEREAAQEMELAAAIAEEKTTRTSSTRWAKAPDGSRGFACSRSPS
jgi:hypothetical protein